MKITSYIPREILNIILEYDGRIKYRNGKYINRIANNDNRYSIIKTVISKNTEVIRHIEVSRLYQYFHFDFIINDTVGIYFDINKLEICYFDTRNKNDWEQFKKWFFF
jgi:hypothetical protein